LQAAHALGAAGLLALAAALAVSLPARAAGDTFNEPVRDPADLRRFAELCEATDGLDRDGAIFVAAGQGFRNVDRVADEIDTFYALREAAFNHRGETNEIILDNPAAALRSFGHAWEAFFIGRDGTLLVMRGEATLAVMNDVPVGEGHICDFLGTGWVVEEEAEAALATLWGEDFGGRGRTIPRSRDWRNVFSGFEFGPNPHGASAIVTVAGAPGDVPPTFTFQYLVEHDLTIPPEVITTIRDAILTDR